MGKSRECILGRRQGFIENSEMGMCFREQWTDQFAENIYRVPPVCEAQRRHKGRVTSDPCPQGFCRVRILKCPIRTERPGEKLRSEGRDGNWGCRKASALLAQIQMMKKMCAQDIILVKLQITFKTNIYKEDWQEECWGRGSSSVSQSFWTTAINLAKVERGSQGLSPDGF